MNNDTYEAPQANLADNDSGTNPLTLKQVLFSFQGRLGRAAYWLTLLGMWVAIMVIVGIIMAISPSAAENNGEAPAAFIAFVLLAIIPVVWISLAIQIKRWHDRNKSGWWIFIQIVPVIGPFWVLIENGFLSGTDGVNDYGLPSK